MQRPESPARRDLRYVYLDVVAWSAMVGVGEVYVTPFALALGMGESLAGLLGTVPLLAGSVLQLISPWGVRRVGSLGRWVVLCVFLQALCFLPLVAAALAGAMPPLALFALMSVYWGTALGAGAAWNTWMDRLVPRRLRARYFATRSRASQVAIGVSLVASGAFLQHLTDQGERLRAFALLFGLGCLFRLVSTGLISRQSDLPLAEGDERRVPFTALLGRRRGTDAGQLLLFMLAVNFTVFTTAPFFAPYFLSQLKVSYQVWVTILAVPYAAQILLLPLWGRVAARFGSRSLLWIGGLGMCPLPVLFAASETWGWLAAVSFLSGAVWSAYELAAFLLVFDAVRREERTSVITTYNLARSLVMVAGSLLGAAALQHLGESRRTYDLLFLVGAVARVGSLWFLWRWRPGGPVVAERLRDTRTSRDGAAA